MAEENYGTDEELAAVKQWWNENWKAVVAGIALALVVLAAWFGWPAYQRGQVEAGAEVYNLEFLPAVDSKDFAAVISVGDQLIDDHSGSVYASLAALEQARVYYVEQNDSKAAEAKLRWVMDDGEAEYQPLATTRLAVLLIDQNRAAEAKELLAGEPVTGAEARWYERRGDALLAMEDYDGARAAYQQALNHEPYNEAWIETKLNNIGLNPLPAPVAETDPESEAANEASNGAASDEANSSETTSDETAATPAEEASGEAEALSQDDASESAE